MDEYPVQRYACVEPSVPKSVSRDHFKRKTHDICNNDYVERIEERKKIMINCGKAYLVKTNHLKKG